MFVLTVSRTRSFSDRTTSGPTRNARSILAAGARPLARARDTTALLNIIYLYSQNGARPPVAAALNEAQANIYYTR